MRLPRDLSGRALAAALSRLGYEVTRQTGSHLRVTRRAPQEHHVTIPDHDVLEVGTLTAILRDIAQSNALSRDELVRLLFS